MSRRNYNRRNYNRDPRTLVARREGVCAETGRPILPGDEILYFPATGATFHMDTKEAQLWREAEFDRTVLGREY